MESWDEQFELLIVHRETSHDDKYINHDMDMDLIIGNTNNFGKDRNMLMVLKAKNR